MLVNIENSALRQALTTVNAAIPGIGENATEIVKFVKFNSGEGKLNLTATNKYSTLFMSVPAECEDNFSLCLPHRQLNSLVRLLDQNLKMKEVRGRVVITQGKTTLQIPCREGSEYPEDGILNPSEAFSGDKIRVTLTSLVTALRMSSVSVGKHDQNRWVLGVLKIVVRDNAMSMYSCDGQQISRVQLPCDYSDTAEIVLPTASLTGVLAFLRASKEDVEIEVAESKIRITTDLGVLVVSTSALRTDQFPDIEKVINNDREFYFSLETEKLTVALQRALFFSAENGYCEIKLEHDAITIHSKDNALGESTEELEVSCPEIEGKGFEIALNGQLLLTALGQAGDTVDIKCSYESRQPIYVESTADEVTLKYLIMRTTHKDPMK